MCHPKSRYFDISTMGATVESLRRHSDLMEQKIASTMDRAKVTEEEWHQPPANATILVIRLGFRQVISLIPDTVCLEFISTESQVNQL